MSDDRAVRRSLRAPGPWASILALTVTLAACGVGPAAAGAQEADPSDSGEIAEAVPAGRQALRDGNFPWYDPQQDSVRPVSVMPQEDDFRGRHSQWDRQKPPPKATTANRPTAFSETMQVLMWVLATVLLAALIALLVWGFLKTGDERSRASHSEGEPAAARIDRIEELPVPIDARQGDLLEQARALFAQGNMREAIIALYSYQLIQLDNAHLIHLERGKTNRQYLREVRRHSQLRTLLERTMVAFEDAFFGNHSLEPSRVAESLDRIDEFQQALRGAE